MQPFEEACPHTGLPSAMHVHSATRAVLIGLKAFRWLNVIQSLARSSTINSVYLITIWFQFIIIDKPKSQESAIQLRRAYFFRDLGFSPI